MYSAEHKFGLLYNGKAVKTHDSEVLMSLNG